MTCLDVILKVLLKTGLFGMRRYAIFGLLYVSSKRHKSLAHCPVQHPRRLQSSYKKKKKNEFRALFQETRCSTAVLNAGYEVLFVSPSE